MVRSIISALQLEKAHHAFLVTSSRFSDPVEKQRLLYLNEYHVSLHNGEAIQEWLRNYKTKSEGGLWLSDDWEDYFKNGWC